MSSVSKEARFTRKSRAAVPSRRGRGRRAQRAGEGLPAANKTTTSQSGFTLAGLIVILTIMMVVLAFTVPRMWSDVLRRERDRQTIFAMKQYARAIAAYQAKHGFPTSLDQIKEARSPRFIRGPKSEWVDPLTGEVDWILVPQTATPTGGPAPGTAVPGTTSSGAPASTSLPESPTDTSSAASDDRIHKLGTSPKNFTGPFIGVRPGVTGRSILVLNGIDRYEQWSYTTNDLTAEIAAAVNGVPPVGAAPTGPAPGGGLPGPKKP